MYLSSTKITSLYTFIIIIYMYVHILYVHYVSVCTIHVLVNISHYGMILFGIPLRAFMYNNSIIHVYAHVPPIEQYILSTVN